MNNNIVLIVGASCPANRDVETAIRLFYISVLVVSAIVVGEAVVKLYRRLNNAKTEAKK